MLTPTLSSLSLAPPKNEKDRPLQLPNSLLTGSLLACVSLVLLPARRLLKLVSTVVAVKQDFPLELLVYGKISGECSSTIALGKTRSLVESSVLSWECFVSSSLGLGGSKLGEKSEDNCGGRSGSGVELH